jgi:hypothetical protein
MKTSHKIIYAVLAIIILIGGYIFFTRSKTTEEPTHILIPTENGTVVPNGLCGFSITSHGPNAKVDLSKTLIIKGAIDNTDRETLDCAWTMFEGQAGTVQAFAKTNGQDWKAIGKETPIPVEDWMTEKTVFSVSVDIDTAQKNLGVGTALKLVFMEENPSGMPPVDEYQLPLSI